MDTEQGSNNFILQIHNLKKYFFVTSGVVFSKVAGVIKAVDDASFSIRRGETLGLVGESGCGKTTLGRCILRLEAPTSGQVLFQGNNLADLKESALRTLRRNIQVIFQDPFSSLNPRMTIEQIIGEAPGVFRLVHTLREKKERVAELLTTVGLRPSMAPRYPHELSGGQRQRVGIARALSLAPAFIVCDEPVSALDVSIQAQIINLLEALQEKFGLTYLFIAHDLSVVRHISDRVAVMYLGKIAELAPSADLYARPLHPYTQALWSAAPIPDPEIEESRTRIILEGDVPSPANPPAGCRFCTRCPQVMPRCREVEPELRELSPGHRVACHLYP